MGSPWVSHEERCGYVEAWRGSILPAGVVAAGRNAASGEIHDLAYFRSSKFFFKPPVEHALDPVGTHDFAIDRLRAQALPPGK